MNTSNPVAHQLSLELGDSENITDTMFSENTIMIVKLSRYLTILVQHVILWHYFKFSAKNTNTC